VNCGNGSVCVERRRPYAYASLNCIAYLGLGAATSLVKEWMLESNLDTETAAENQIQFNAGFLTGYQDIVYVGKGVDDRRTPHDQRQN